MLGGLDWRYILGRYLRATTKKGRQLFCEKSAPPDKILATPMLENTLGQITVGETSEVDNN